MKADHLPLMRDGEILRQIHQRVAEEVPTGGFRLRLLLAFKAVVYIGLSVACYWGVYAVGHPVGFVFCYVGYGLSTVLLAFNFAHDCAHGTVFGSQRANYFCFVALYTLVGAHGAAWRRRHIREHHHAPNVEGYDPDLRITHLIRLLPSSPLAGYHCYQHLYAPVAYSIYSLYWIFIKDVVVLYSTEADVADKDWRYHFAFWVQKAVYLTVALVLPLCYAGQPVGWVLVGFGIMHLVLSEFLLFTFIMTHHVERTAYPAMDADGRIQASWLMNQVASSNDMHPFSAAANFLFGGFNNHTAHHLFPHYHHIYYTAISRIVYRVLQEHQIRPNYTTYWGGVVSHLRLLRRMGRE